MSQFQRLRVQAVCVDMWPAFTNSIQHWLPEARIVYDKFHIMQHANQAVDEVRRAEFFRKGGRMRGIVKGKRWLLLTRWVNLESRKRQELNGLFALNRRVMKAYLLKESLDRLWTYGYEGAMVRYAALDGSTSMAPAQTLSEAGGDAARSSGRHPELLPRAGSLRSRRGH